MKITMVAATAAVGVLALVGCSSGGGGSETSRANDDTSATTPSGDREALVRAMVSEGATEEVANCFIDEVGIDDTQRIRASEDSELSETDMANIERALETCDPELLRAGTTAP